MTFSKSDITYHQLGYGYDSAPAVNVKVYAYPTDDLVRQVATDLGFDADRVLAWWHEYAESNDALQVDAFSLACERGYDDLQDYAREIWEDRSLTVYSEGRSGGWAYIDQIRADAVEGWNAIDVMRWARFAKYARACADDVPYRMVNLIVANAYPQPAKDDGAMILA